MGGMSYRPTLHEIELVQEWNAAIEAAAKECDELDEIKRWGFIGESGCSFQAYREGKYVLYADHIEALASFARRIRALKKEG